MMDNQTIRSWNGEYSLALGKPSGILKITKIGTGDVVWQGKPKTDLMIQVGFITVSLTSIDAPLSLEIVNDRFSVVENIAPDVKPEVVQYMPTSRGDAVPAGA